MYQQQLHVSSLMADEVMHRVAGSTHQLHCQPLVHNWHCVAKRVDVDTILGVIC